ncbi:hypothetical protein CRUP_011944 [Coryphaenoides rupestris]|nr:hypothetical protein CRUP_011944 [Coryphaenoides rupestris]
MRGGGDEEDVCKLYCITEDFDFFFAMSSKVKDGTSCAENKGGVCIEGVCTQNNGKFLGPGCGPLNQLGCNLQPMPPAGAVDFRDQQ